MEEKNWKGNKIVKVVLFMATTVALFGLVAGSVLMGVSIASRSYYMAGGTSQSAILRYLWNNMTTNYASYLFESGTSAPDSTDWQGWDALEGSGLHYAVEQVSFYVETIDGQTQVIRSSGVISGDEAIIDWAKRTDATDENGLYQYDYQEGWHYTYDVQSLQGAMSLSTHTMYTDTTAYTTLLTASDGSYMMEYDEPDGGYSEDIEVYVFDEQTGETYETTDIITGSTPEDGEYIFYRIYMMPDAAAYAKATGQNVADFTSYESIAQDTIGTLGHGRKLSEASGIGDLFALFSKLSSTSESLKFSDGAIDYFWVPYVIAGMLASVNSIYLPVFLVSLAASIVLFIFLMTVSGHEKTTGGIRLRFIDRLPYGIYLVIVGTGVSIGALGDIELASLYLNDSLSIRDAITFFVLITVATEMLALAFCMSTASRIKSGEFFKHTACHYIILPFRRIWAFAKENVALSVRLGIGLVILFLLELFGVSLAIYDYAEMMAFFLIYKILETLFIYYLVAMAGRLKAGGERVANGDFSQPIDTTHMIGSLREHGENINRIGDGLEVAVERQMKSERLKTELITNVSHDIKTPLTSIINYVDLIKKENVTDPKVRDYIEVLDRQSKRLKKLIADLLEASKASTGNVEMQMQTCDAIVMITQVTGEYEERLQKDDIEMVFTQPEESLLIRADGRHLWRVLDNIMSNIVKYTQEHTRVYISAESVDDEVRMTFKNVSKYPLNITNDELMERFVRGDASRNTEGHGLGLSIAKSLTELMNGRIEIEIDGDLYKIMVLMKRVNEEKQEDVVAEEAKNPYRADASEDSASEE